MTIRNGLATFVATLLCGTGLSAAVIGDSEAQEARSAYAYVTANLNQRAGPATRYPSLGVIPSRTQVRINGCLPDLSWCEGAYGDLRGWMSANYLRLYDYRQQAWVEVEDYAGSTQLPRYTFNLDRYWEQHYADRAFYPQRAAWLAPSTSPTIDKGVFYRELTPYGRWVAVDGQYVWMPNVREGWRPYTDGRWEYTQRYGWTWVSNEPFGWATYHYGRWAYSNRLGWVWQPGTQWAPAWVAWRGSEDHLAWAPLPPDAGPGFRLGDDFNEIPRYYWQVVPSQDFLQPNLIDVVVRNDQRERYDWLDRARPIGNSTVINNTVVNNVVNIDYVEKKTNKKVVQRDVVITNREAPERAAAEAPDSAIRIYQPPVTEAPAMATPPAVLPASVAETQSQTAGQAGDAPGPETRLADAPAEAEAAAPPTEAPPLDPEEAAAPEPAPAAEEPVAPPPSEQPVPAPSEEAAPPPPATDEPQAAEEPPPAAEPAPPPADAQPPAAEEPPAPPADAAPQPPADEAAPPPPADQPPAAEEPQAPPADAAPPPPADEPAPPPPAAEEPPPPPPVDAPPPAAEEPPPPPADAAPPPPAVEPAPPPPAAEEPSPPPADAPPPAVEEPQAPPADAAPPPPADEPAPPPPPESTPAAAAEEPAPPPPVADEPPPPPAAEAPAPAPQAAPAPETADGKDCPKGERLNNKGQCVPRKK